MKNRKPNAFTLIEMLTVIAIITFLGAVTVPALQALSSASGVAKAASDLSGTYDFARTYAMANNTYVRIGICQVPSGTGEPLPLTVILSIFSKDGSLAADTSAAMSDTSAAAAWQQLNRPLVLHNLCLFDGLNAQTPDTSGDTNPSTSTISSISRLIPALGTLTFTGIVQFNPSGEAGVIENTPSRYIKIAIDQPKAPADTGVARDVNPFIVRLSGINGSIDVLRSENQIK